MNYTEIANIENWFARDSWNKTWEEREKEETEHPRKFLQTYIKEFWLHLSILEIISLAYSYKTAAYTAYYENIKNFGDFSREIWENKTLDLRKLPTITSKIAKT